ncbi:MAG: AMP-binding protein, partial [bacterium]
ARLTVWFSVPSTGVFMKRLGMLKPNSYPNLRVSLFCGEALPVGIARAWTDAAPNSIVENLYGPTELTIACTAYRWLPQESSDECALGTVPIGYPFPGMQVLIVDSSLHEVLDGEEGELLMTGLQLTPGYWKDEERTAAAFVRPPGKSAVYYRTGDRVRKLKGSLPMIYLGRIDNQVKIRGYRVELGEVEAAVRGISGVDTVVAVGWPKTASGAGGVEVFLQVEDIDLKLLRETLATRLPPYMVPRQFHLRTEFPLNANGKYDRQALLNTLEEES